jgi:hypothetical protein
MSSIWTNARMDMSDRGLSHPFEDVGAVANGLSGIRIVLVKCFYILTGAEFTSVFCPPQKIQRIEFRWKKSTRGHTLILTFFLFFGVGNSLLKFFHAVYIQPLLARALSQLRDVTGCSLLGSHQRTKADRNLQRCHTFYTYFCWFQVVLVLRPLVARSVSGAVACSRSLIQLTRMN